MGNPLSINELNQLYSESEQIDADLFAEQRSNILLVAGDHFARKSSRFWNRIREAKDITDETKLRLTQNHLHKICRTYVNAIVSYAPGAGISPRNNGELQDQKAAELHNAVWQHIKTKHKLKKRTREYAQDFVDIGELFVKVFWDPTAGEMLGYEAEVDEAGNPLFKHPHTGEVTSDAISVVSGPAGPQTLAHEPLKSNRPVFSGDLCFERHHGFNILRAPEAKTMDESRYLVIRKMVDIEILRSMVGDDEDKKKLLEASSDETYTVFDGAQGTYSQSKNQCLVREFYFRKCPEYPNGYFYIATKAGILYDGEIPLGIFPIIHTGFDEVATTPRAHSILKQCRPFQAEINRTASKIAETQITSDDKLLIQHGTKVSQGGHLPGIRAVQYQGAPPTILPGRAGDQYQAHLEAQVKYLYMISNMAEELEERASQTDPYTMLFQSIRNKKKFSLYAEKFEQFEVELCDVALRLFKAYAHPNCVVPVLGKREFVNIEEFKRADDLGYQIKIEPQVDDAETKLGRQLTMNTIIQYAGTKLEKDDIGRLIKMSPYGNTEEAFDDWTIDYENATNDILALDRGQMRPAGRYDNHEYVLRRLTKRVKSSDFAFLDPRVQQLYSQKIADHEQALQRSQAEALAAKSSWIPTTGLYVPCDLYVQDPANPLKTRRARFPQDALNWLKKQLESQGFAEDKFNQMQLGVQADMGAMASGPPQGPSPLMQSQLGSPIANGMNGAPATTGPMSPF